MAASSKGAVLSAVIGNGFLTVIKGVAFLVSGSGAMLSETVHSFADTANQVLLFLGIQRSERPADARFPYGYGGERYLFALLSAAGIFVLGCGVSVYHGVRNLLEPHELHLSWITWAVLVLSFLIEAWVLVVAARSVRAAKGERTFFQYLRTTTDPTVAAVLMEDAIACLGVLIAAAGIGLSALTHNPIFDSLSSILIGVLLGLLAIWLGLKNRTLILGPAIPHRVQQSAVALVREDPAVKAVREVKTRVLAADRFNLQADVDFDGRYLGAQLGEWVRDRLASVAEDDEPDYDALAADFGERLLDLLGDEVNRIEGSLSKSFPRLHHVDLEAD